MWRMWRITFHGHVKLNLMTIAATLTAFALYNHACYNIEIFIKLLAFLFNVYKRFFIIFVTFLTFYYFNMNVFKPMFSAYIYECWRERGVTPQCVGCPTPVTQLPFIPTVWHLHPSACEFYWIWLDWSRLRCWVRFHSPIKQAVRVATQCVPAPPALRTLRPTSSP